MSYALYPTGTSISHILADNTQVAMIFNAAGQEISTGIQVLNGTPAQIIAQCDLVMSINSSGATIL